MSMNMYVYRVTENQNSGRSGEPGEPFEAFNLSEAKRISTRRQKVKRSGLVAWIIAKDPQWSLENRPMGRSGMEMFYRFRTGLGRASLRIVCASILIRIASQMSMAGSFYASTLSLPCRCERGSRMTISTSRPSAVNRRRSRSTEYWGLSSNGTGMYAKGCRPGAATPPQVQRSGPVARAVPRL